MRGTGVPPVWLVAYWLWLVHEPCDRRRNRKKKKKKKKKNMGKMPM